MSLKKRKEILEKNIAEEEDMIKNNKSYTGPNGKTYGPDHYKRAIEYDKKELDNVNSQLLDRAKKKQQLVGAMKEAGVGQGIKGVVSDKVKQAVSNIGKNIATREVAREVGTGGLASKIQGLRDAEDKALKKRKK